MLAAGLLGMTFGALVAGAAGDRWGRKNTTRRKRRMVWRFYYLLRLVRESCSAGSVQIFVRTGVWRRTSERGARETRGARQITHGSTDAMDPTWSQDGNDILYSTSLGTDERVWPEDTEIFALGRNGETSDTRQLTQRLGPDRSPLVSPDDEWIVYAGLDVQSQRKGYEATELYALRRDGTQRQVLTRTFEEGIGEQVLVDMPAPIGDSPAYAWSTDSKAVLFRSMMNGNGQLFSASRDGVVRPVVSATGDLREFSVGGIDRVAVTWGGPKEPGDIYTFDLRTGSARDTWRRLTSFGSQLAQRYALAEYEELRCSRAGIQGWLIQSSTPAVKPRPLVLYVHGGPAAMYGRGFFFEFQLLASAGYAVLITNPAMSTGYGAEFSKADAYRFPAGDVYEQLMQCTEEVATRPAIDSKRMAIAGGSAGGLITAYSIGQTSRFKAAIVERAVTNFHSWVISNDLPDWYISRWFGGRTPWAAPGDYLARSPLAYVERVTTPVLVIHNTDDYRVPIEQGMQYYSALRLLGKPARLAVFPDSNHGMSRDGRPSQRVERLQLILKWLEEHLQ